MDKENILPEIPTEKIFKPIGIYIATFFGGPLVAAYLISANYKAFKEPRNQIKTWVIGLLGTVLIVAFSTTINARATRQIPGYLFPLIYSVITYSVVNLAQKQKISAFISAGGEFFPSTRILVITIIGFIITVFGLMIVANIFDFLYQFA